MASPPLTVCSQSAARRPRQAWTGHACLQSTSYFLPGVDAANFLGDLLRHFSLDEHRIMEYAKADQIEKLEQKANEKANLNREQNRRNGANLKNEIKKLVEGQFDEMRNIVSALRGILPYDRLLLSPTDGCLVPLEDKYFRIDPKGLGFKYGGEMICIGRVTNVIGEDTDPCDNSFIFSTIQFQVNEAFRKILPTKHSNLYVLHPMAVYYE